MWRLAGRRGRSGRGAFIERASSLPKTALLSKGKKALFLAPSVKFLVFRAAAFLLPGCLLLQKQRSACLLQRAAAQLFPGPIPVAITSLPLRWGQPRVSLGTVTTLPVGVRLLEEPGYPAGSQQLLHPATRPSRLFWGLDGQPWAGAAVGLACPYQSRTVTAGLRMSRVAEHPSAGPWGCVFHSPQVPLAAWAE